MSLSTGEDSGLSCTGGKLNLSLSLEDIVTSSAKSKSVFSFDSGEEANLPCPRRDLQSIAGYGAESDWDLFCSGDSPDFKLGLIDNLLLSCVVGDLGASSVIGDEDLDRPPFGGV